MKKLNISCSPLPKCDDCGLQNSENCNTCPRLNSEGLDTFDFDEEEIIEKKRKVGKSYVAKCQKILKRYTDKNQ
jgi:hypothetical protein